MKSKEEIAKHFTQLWEDSTDDTSIALQKMFVEAITQASEQLTRENAALKVDYANAYIDLGDLHNKLNQANEAKERAVASLAEMNDTLEKRETRLQIDPSGSDKIDELESVVKYLREAKEKAESSIRDMQCTYDFGAKVMNKLCIPNAKNFLQEEKAFEFLARMMEEKEKAERKLQGVLDERKEIVERIGAENTQLRAKAEKAERKAEARRLAIEQLFDLASGCTNLLCDKETVGGFSFNMNSKVYNDLVDSLMPNAGSTFVPSSDLKEARELLEKLEWIKLDDDALYCSGCHSMRYRGHKPDCKLQAFLAKTK